MKYCKNVGHLRTRWYAAQVQWSHVHPPPPLLSPGVVGLGISGLGISGYGY